MSDTIINQKHIKDFQHISYFLNENNIPITSVTEIIFDDAFFCSTNWRNPQKFQC